MATNTFRRVMHKLFKCEDMHSLLKTARTFVRSPMILADLSFQVLSITEETDIDDPRWIQIRDDRMIPLDLLNLRIYHDAVETGEPQVTADTYGLTVVRCAVADSGRMVGYLMCPCYGGVPTREELDMLQITADLSCLRLKLGLHYAEYPENLQDFFIADLLNGRLTDEQQILDRCTYFDWKPPLPYIVLSIGPAVVTARTSNTQLLEEEAFLRKKLPDFTLFQYGNRLKLMVPVTENTIKDELQLAELEELLASRHLVAGVSETARRLTGLPRRNQQAEKAMELGQLFRSRETLMFYQKYAIYHCLEICSNEINLLHCCHQSVILLEHYDREHGTELLETLHAYLINNLASQKAAEALHIHRNTLIKRLDKITDMTGIDLTDSETVFHLQFSYRILEYHGATVLRSSYESWMERSPTLQHP